MKLLLVFLLALGSSASATRITLQHGQIIATGTPAEVITPAFLHATYGLEARVLPDEKTGTLLIIPE